jgi:HPt (histidine-containing phosphotransfer) domain-containing protein
MTEKKIRAEVSKDLEPLIPRYLDRRHKEIETFRTQLAVGDFEALRIGGHSLKGSGGGYGFPDLTRIGATIETAAKANDAGVIQTALTEYADYMLRVEVTFI